MALTAGTRLGPYEILAPIGAGGMGEVYRARDTNLKRDVALKILPEAFAHDADRMARFQREAQVLASLNHPNIAQIYGIEDRALVMELVEGQTLQGPLPLETALNYARQIAEALEAAHRKGIIHRDLKPANIMVTEGASVKLLDFGLAKLVAKTDSDVTRTIEGTVLGTAAYMAPEQAQGKPLDERSDIFSFGAVLYEMLSGSRAFAGNSTAEVMSAVLRDEPKPLPASGEIVRIVTRCLRKSPADRFQTMAEVKAALQQLSAKPAERQPSIAVLPFANLSADKEQEYFSDGLAEEIINLLAHIPGLKVIARTSAFAFRGKEQDIRRIAEALGVAHLLEGSVRRAGNRIRVTAQLINAEDGSHIWSERYDRELTDVFAIQDEIAQVITSALHVKISAVPAKQKRYTPALPAYDALLKGRYHLSRWTPESLARSKGYFEQAIALDPKFALAHEEFARYYNVLSLVGSLPVHETAPLARAEAQRALAIDPSLPEAHALLANMSGYYDFDWKEAQRRYDLVMTYEPVSADVRRSYAVFLFLTGRPQQAIEEVECVIKEDPLEVMPRMNLHAYLQVVGRDQEAYDQLNKVLELDENFFAAHISLAILQALEGTLPLALRSAQKAYSLAPSYPSTIATLAALLRRTGDESGADRLLQKLEPGDAFGAPRGFAIFYLLCGEVDRAADWAERAIEQRDLEAMFFLYFALSRALRSSARWPKLARMMNLPGTA